MAEYGWVNINFFFYLYILSWIFKKNILHLSILPWQRDTQAELLRPKYMSEAVSRTKVNQPHHNTHFTWSYFPPLYSSLHLTTPNLNCNNDLVFNCANKAFLPVGSNPRQVGLSAHNTYRRIHDAPDMQLDRQLNDDAQRYASKLARESSFEHDPNNRGQGENLGLQCAPGSDGDLVKKVVDAWWVRHGAKIDLV